jgi:hypothetical protein
MDGNPLRELDNVAQPAIAGGIDEAELLSLGVLRGIGE